MKQDVGWREILAPLAAGFAGRAEGADENDAYVEENFSQLKQSGLLAAGVPAELGGMGLGIEELCALLAEVARACPSTRSWSDCWSCCDTGNRGTDFSQSA